MLLKIKKQLELMWERGGFIITLILLIALGLSLNRPKAPLEEPAKAPSLLEVNASDFIDLVKDKPQTLFGWQELEKTKTWRYSPAVTYNLEEGKEILSPKAGTITAMGEKIIIDHGDGYQSQIWPIRAYYFEGNIQQGEIIGKAYSQALNWSLTYYGTPVDPLTRGNKQP